MSLSKPLLSVVIPVYEECDILPDTLKTIVAVLTSISSEFEIIVVDDGSRDASFAQITAVHDYDPRIKGIRLSRNFGKEAALLAGLKRANGRAVITIDADLQHPPDLIPKLVEQWQAGAAIVHAVKQERRSHHSVAQQFKNLLRSERREEGRLYQWAQYAFNWAFSRAAGFDMMGSSDFKLLDAKVARLLVERFPEYGRFYRGLSTWIGFKQALVPFTVQPRSGGNSHWSVAALMRYAWHTLTAFSAVPLQIIPLLGVLMFIVTLVLGVEAVISRLSGNAVSGFATLEITILFTGSLIMIGLGIIGRYLAQIYDELKRRPVFLVAEEIGFDEKD